MPRCRTFFRGSSWFLLALFALKLLTTSLTLGSGASGGVFSPALYLGATLGGAYGLAARQLFPALSIHPAAFAVAGMAGVVGGSTGAAMAAIVMIFEMTLDYTVIIPMTMTVALSYGIRTLLEPQSIYTMKLARRGHVIPAALQANFYSLKSAKEVMDTQFVVVAAGGAIEDFARTASEHPNVSYFLVETPTGLIGFLTRDSLTRVSRKPETSLTLADLADRRFLTVNEETTLKDVMISAAAPLMPNWLWSRTAWEPLQPERAGTDHQTADRPHGHGGVGGFLGLSWLTGSGPRRASALKETSWLASSRGLSPVRSRVRSGRGPG